MNSKIDYEALFHESPNAYLVISSDFVLRDMNEAYLRLVDRSREELVGRHVFEAFPVDPESPDTNQAELLKASLDRVFKDGKADVLAVIRYPIPISTVEGQGFRDEFWSVSNHPLRDRDGHIPFVFQNVENVTELRDTLEQATAEADQRRDGAPLARDPSATGAHQMRSDVLRRAEQVRTANRMLESDRLRLLRLFDQSLSFTVFMREPEHIVELANPAYLRLVGETDLRDRRYGEAHRADPPVPVKLLDAVYQTGAPIIEHGLALRVPDSDSGETKLVYVDVVIQQIVDGAGKVIGVFMQGNDVTTVKAAQDELHAYRTRLEELVTERTRALEKSEEERRTAEAALHRAQRLEAVGKLTGGVAHDFNNVLQIVRGNLQLLQKTVAPDSKPALRIKAALDGVERGAKLAAQLLAFGRRQPLEPIVVNLEVMLRRMDDLLHRALGESIQIQTLVAPDLWNTLVDVPRLENVILNIALNARDAMDHSGTLTMRLDNAALDAAAAARFEGLEAGEYVTLAFTDTGHGMSPDVQRRAFEPFFTTKPDGEGTGLGLSMVYGFVKQSGGDVALESEEGRGTTITLYLPRSTEPVSDFTIAPASETIEGGGETILVVEDDAAVRATVADTLTELGYRVLRASDGESALTIIRSGVPIDLLFTDVVMPGPVPSTEMVRLAREILPGIHILHTSGFTSNAIVHGDRLDAGINLLGKPYSREELAKKLRHLLDNERLSPEVTPAAPAARDNVHTVQPASDAPTPPLPRRRILLVEDSEEVRETTIEFMSELDYDVIAVPSAEAALAALDAERFDIVFTDVSLPGMSGLALLKRVRETLPQQRFVIASGYGSDFGKHEFGDDVGLLAKPYDLTMMERVLERVLAA